MDFRRDTSVVKVAGRLPADRGLGFQKPRNSSLLENLADEDTLPNVLVAISGVFLRSMIGVTAPKQCSAVKPADVVVGFKLIRVQNFVRDQRQGSSSCPKKPLGFL